MDHVTAANRNNAANARARILGANFSNLSSVELGAQRGIGPLSPRGEVVWHGDSRPCPSCGQLVRRTAAQCDQCGQLLTGDMMQRMRACSGPWYVLEHVRPFPGVSKDRLIKQIKRGVLTQTTIIRGPTTHHQWRYAGETPGLSKYLGLCWSCQAHVLETDTICHVCRKNLDSDGEEVLIEGDETLKPQSAELDRLKAAVSTVAPRPRAGGEGPARIGPVRASWLITALVLLVLIGVYLLVLSRDASLERSAPRREPTPPKLAPDWSPAQPAQPSDGESPAAGTQPAGGP